MEAILKQYYQIWRNQNNADLKMYNSMHNIFVSWDELVKSFSLHGFNTKHHCQFGGAPPC